jgi:hypothetical protein
MAPSYPSTRTSGFNAVRRGFIRYARWLQSISWKRFFVISLLSLIAASMLAKLPPFNIRWGADTDSSEIRQADRKRQQAIKHAADEVKRRSKALHREKDRSSRDDGDQDVNVSFDKDGIHISTRKRSSASSGATAASDAASSASSAYFVPPVPPVPPSPPAVPKIPDINITLPRNADEDDVKEAIADAKAEVADAVREANQAGLEAAQDVLQELQADFPSRSRGFRVGDHMPDFMFLLIFLSGIIKVMAAGRFKAEAVAEQATEMAESEALKRQVVEARMAAMQAQVEPHFLFNTLASIDHLIETDPPRASKMQKNLIALLRASMPTMREANAQGTRDLGRELAVIRPYLEILKVRMEERLVTDIRVSEGLLSAEFPPMMLQGLVENAIKHGLEPKAEGGHLTVSAEIVHGQLAVSVADTGLGFGKAATAGTGIGLSNIRERLQLLYGQRAQLAITETPGGGTTVTITVPYLIRDMQNPQKDAA